MIQACGNVKSAAGLLGLDWDSVHRIMERAVERGLERRELETVPYVGIDEKSFGGGQSYISLLTDLSGSYVLEVAECERLARLHGERFQPSDWLRERAERGVLFHGGANATSKAA